MRYSLHVILVQLIYCVVASGADIEIREVAKLTAGTPMPYSLFSDYAVAIDNNTAVVGMHTDSTSSGSVSVFERNATTGAFELKAILTATDANSSDQLGISVDIDGDTIVAGAYGDDEAANAAGALYVYVKPEGGWHDANETAKLTVLNAQEKEYLGYSVAISGDTVVGGAYGNADQGTRTGIAYVYVKPENGWVSTTQNIRLRASEAAGGDMFAAAVAIDGDTIVAGAYGKEAAYLFLKPDTGWEDNTEDARLNASDNVSGDYFGGAVALENNTVVISAYLKDHVGKVYLYEKPPAGWTDIQESAKLSASDPTLNDAFGVSLALSGNVVAVGAHFDDDLGESSGSVYLFQKPSGGWADANETLKVHASDSTADSYFGQSLSMDANLMLVGAPYDDCENGDINCGAAYVYRLQTQNAITPALLYYLLN